MTFFHSPQSLIDQNTFGLRRSDRKRTKKIIKDDFMLPNPFKGKIKKHRGLRLPQNLGCQIRKIQFLTQRTLATLNYGKQGFNIQMLNQMKQAVNQQQNKLYEFLSIKLTEDKIAHQNQIYPHPIKNHKLINQKQNTPNFQQNQPTSDEYHLNQFHKEILGISTSQQFYKELQSCQLQQANQSAFHDESEFQFAQQPKFRKESSKLLSDNYQNHELMYTIEHMMPNWHRQEIQMNSEPQFSD